MFRSIIVPVDGSRLAECAIPYAISVATRARSKVRFVLVYPEPHPPLLIEPVKGYLQQLTERYRPQLGSALSSIVLNGPAAVQLAQHAQEIGADLVVMTTHGWGGFRRAWLGSVADELIRTIDVPVLVVHPAEDGSLPPFEITEIMVPLDGSTLAETALEPAAELAKLWDAELSLVQMVYPTNLVSDPALPIPGGYDPELTAMQRHAATDYVRRLALGLRVRGVRASGVALVGEKPVAQSLIELASPERVSLVALATHGRGGIRRLVLGSVSDKLVRGAGVPILVTPGVRSARQRQALEAGTTRAEGGEALAPA